LKKRIAMLAALMMFLGAAPSQAHVGAYLRGFSDVAGQSSTVYLRLGMDVLMKQITLERESLKFLFQLKQAHLAQSSKLAGGHR
jgi:hypothetical protein